MNAYWFAGCVGRSGREKKGRAQWEEGEKGRQLLTHMKGRMAHQRYVNRP